MEYRTVEQADHEMVIEHLRRTFFIDEPLNKAVRLCPNGEGHEDLEKQCIATLNDGLSILAMEDGQIKAVALNGVVKPGDSCRALHKLLKSSDEKFVKIFTLLLSVTEDLKLFDKYQVDAIFETKILSVDPEARGKGLAGELMKRSIELAREKGFKLIKGDATGIYSQKICESVGMETLQELYYKDYLDADTGSMVFDVEAPHTTLKIMAMRL